MTAGSLDNQRDETRHAAAAMAALAEPAPHADILPDAAHGAFFRQLIAAGTFNNECVWPEPPSPLPEDDGA